METIVGMEARICWGLLTVGDGGILREQEIDYCGMIERMEASKLLEMMDMIQRRLDSLQSKERAVAIESDTRSSAVSLFISKDYSIRLNGPQGPLMPLRPLVKSLFILFLKHPEGILLKRRDSFEKELEDIYATIVPEVDEEVRHRRIQRLTNPQDNSFSEKASVLNATLERLLPAGIVDGYKIQGANGHPRRIPLDPLLVEWE